MGGRPTKVARDPPTETLSKEKVRNAMQGKRGKSFYVSDKEVAEMFDKLKLKVDERLTVTEYDEAIDSVMVWTEKTSDDADAERGREGEGEGEGEEGEYYDDGLRDIDMRDYEAREIKDLWKEVKALREFGQPEVALDVLEDLYDRYKRRDNHMGM